ncbi:hypothetical protein HKD37_20G056441 [Glycine soja]
MFHQEDGGLNTEMAKLAFCKGIWNYVCKMDNALRRYSIISYHLSSSVTTSVDLMQKFTCKQDAEKAIQKLNGSKFAKRLIVVDWVVSKKIFSSDENNTLAS